MADVKVTVDTILDFLKEAVESKAPIAPSTWIDAAMKLNVLLGDENDKLYDLQQKVALIRLGFLTSQNKVNVSEAKLRTEVTDEYKQYHKQKARIAQIEEQIRIAKVQARVRDTEFKG